MAAAKKASKNVNTAKKMRNVSIPEDLYKKAQEMCPKVAADLEKTNGFRSLVTPNRVIEKVLREHL